VFVKKPNESTEHVLMKAFLWALYLPDFPHLTVEIRIGDRYKPDVVALDPQGTPLFWGEAGQVGSDKIRSLLRRRRHTHFAVAKWSSSFDALADLVHDELAKQPREAPVDLISFPDDSAERFIGATGTIRVTHRDLNWTRIR
jgi:hypothetical protein